jgi:anti-anti-sigma factor
LDADRPGGLGIGGRQGVRRGTQRDRYAAFVPGPHLAVTVVKAGEHSLLRLTGTLDLATVVVLVAEGAQILHATSETLTLDVGGVDFCDSTGLAGLVKIWNSAKALGMQVHVHNSRPQMQRLLITTGLASTFGVPDPWDDQI